MDGVETGKSRSDWISSELGKKLLMGWTMMGISCPSEDCYTPLMKDKKDRLYCVSCDQFILTEKKEEAPIEEKSVEDKSTYNENERQIVQTVTTPTEISSSSMVVPSSLASISQDLVLELTVKLKKAHEDLKNSQDYIQMKTICAFIKECVSVIESLSGLQQ